jgi:RND family efflux transporter MFP subunit
LSGVRGAPSTARGFARIARSWGGALLLAPWLLAGCGEQAPPEPEVVRPVKIVEVGQGSAARREYPGRIRAVQYSEMAFEVPGRIVEFSVKEGERVTEGQALVRLDPRDYESKLQAATARLEHAATERERARILYEKKVKPKAEYDMAARYYDVQAADAATAKKALEDTVLRAPFTGVMARKLVTDFSNVQAKQPVLIVQDDSSLEVKVSVPERDLTGRTTAPRDLDEISRRIHPRVVLSSVPDREFPARLTELAEVADPTTRTFEATFAFGRPEGTNVLGGMTAKVVLDVPAQAGTPGVALPASSVVSDSAEAPYVWVVDPATMQVSRRAVELGPLSGSEVRVQAGLDAGEWVVASGVHQIREGATVRRLER